MKIKETFNRYPGLVPFDKTQSSIFFGRDQEKKDLFYLVSLEKMVVFFGKSGLGKSSLLNAGLCPLLDANGFSTFKVRFNLSTESEHEEKENRLLHQFILSFNGYSFQPNILYNSENPKLWEYIKAAFGSVPGGGSVETTQSSDFGPTARIPVFILDQFEEFFQHPLEHQREFLEQLSEIVHDETPNRILEWITSIDFEKRTQKQIDWHLQPNLKIVFALRSERLADMQILAAYIPTVLRKRYELNPLTEIEARQAIIQPALKDLGGEYTPPFSYNPDTLNEILTALGKGKNEIASFELQVVCNYIENKIKLLRQGDSGKTYDEINGDIINPLSDISFIRDNLYENLLKENIPDPNNRLKIRNLIEDQLVVGGQRDAVSEKRLQEVYGFSDDLIQDMVNTRLVRAESTTRGMVYELSHDTLIATVEKSKMRRIEEETKARVELEKEELRIKALAKDQELKEKNEQLNLEKKLRAEADQQRAKAEKLSKKVKRLGTWVSLLAITIAVIVSVLLLRNNNRLYNKLEIARTQTDSVAIYLDSAKEDLNVALDYLEKTESEYMIRDSTDVLVPEQNIIMPKKDSLEREKLEMKNSQRRVEMLKRKYYKLPDTTKLNKNK